MTRIYDEMNFDRADESLNNFQNDYFSDDSYKMYLKEIDKYPLLSDEETMMYYNAMNNGDKDAKQLLVNSNLRLVISVAKRYLRLLKSLSFLDIIQEGNIGLINGIEKFDPSLGALSTCLVYWIKQSILRAIADKNDSIRKPVYLYDNVLKYKKYLAQAKLVGEPIDDYKLCNDLDITLENLENIRIVINQEVVSINKPVADDSETELSEFIASDKNLVEPPEDKLATDELVAVLRTVLLPVEYYILSERILFSSRRLEDISSEFFVTRQWISQTELRAKEKIKPYMQEDSMILVKTLKTIRNGEAVVKNAKRRATSPLDIVKYIFIKDRLTCIEKMLYWRLYFDIVSYSDIELASLLNIRVREIDLFKKSLASKLVYIEENIEEFNAFRQEVMQEYRTKIYRYIKENKSDITFKFDGYSYVKFISYYGNFINTLCESDKTLIYNYFDLERRVKMSGFDKDRVYEIFDLLLKSRENGVNLLLKLDKKD